MSDPLTIHIDKMIELLEGLGIDPVDPEDIRSVTVNVRPGEVVVRRYRRNEAGRMALGVEAGFPAMQTTTIAIVGMPGETRGED